MKVKQFVLATSIALMLGAASQAATETIHITGSTAFRASAVAAIKAYLGAGVTGAFVGSGNTQNGGESGATYDVFQNTVSGNTYVFQLTWTGSVGGIIVETQQDDIKNVPTNGWLSVSNIAAAQSASTTPGTPGIYPIATGTYDSGAIPPDANFSDSLQATTGYNTPALKGAGTANGGTGQVGVIPFDWVFGDTNSANATATAGAPTSATVPNITSLQAQALLPGGIPLSQLTGNVANDSGTIVYPIGRNFDSGTRLSEFIETGFGFRSAPAQLGVGVNSQAESISGGSALGTAGSKITTIGLFPADTLFPGRPYQLTFQPGQSGYASGGTVAKVLETPGSITASQDPTNPTSFGASGYLVSYLGRSDANTAVTNRTVDTANTAFKINYDGFSDDAGNVNIENGLYHGWEYEYLYYTPRTTNPLDANQKNAINSVADLVYNTYASTAGIPIPSMNVSKSVEGGVIHY